MERHYGMDWLRIGAFGVLILYHIGMVFVPWPYHVKATPPLDWVTIPMLLPSAWRLTLLFVVSGYASRALLRKQGGVGAFVRNRSVRLLLPLAFGVAIIVPPQPWVELVTHYGYPIGFWRFWTHRYFDFDRLGGLMLPTTNHLWFVAYLWVYTMVLALCVPWIRGGWAQRWFDRLFGGWRALVLPQLWMAFVHLWLTKGIGETHDLLHDPAAHWSYLPAFLFGFGLAGSPATFDGIRRWWKVAGVLAILAYFAAVGIQWTWLDVEAPPMMKTLFYVARAVQAWTTIIALIGLAETFWNRDHHLRPMLTEAVFPFYLVHQTIIVVVGYWLIRFSLHAGIEFAILFAATVFGCWAFYLLGREIALLRPLIGLKGHRR